MNAPILYTLVVSSHLEKKSNPSFLARSPVTRITQGHHPFSGHLTVRSLRGGQQTPAWPQDLNPRFSGVSAFKACSCGHMLQPSRRRSPQTCCTPQAPFPPRSPAANPSARSRVNSSKQNLSTERRKESRIKFRVCD